MHVLSTPPAFVLSQNQTLRYEKRRLIPPHCSPPPMLDRGCRESARLKPSLRQPAPTNFPGGSTEGSSLIALFDCQRTAKVPCCFSCPRFLPLRQTPKKIGSSSLAQPGFAGGHPLSFLPGRERRFSPLFRQGALTLWTPSHLSTGFSIILQFLLGRGVLLA